VPAPVELVSVIVGFGILAIAGARLGAGSHTSLVGLFGRPALDDWPHGVQEGDVPRFAVEHADALRHRAAPESPIEDLEPHTPGAPRPALVELEVRRVTSRRDD
jgi:hypothetical protein